MTEGKIEIATGPMFSGKTEWLIETIKKRKNVLVIKYLYDARYAETSVKSHNGKSISAINAVNLNEIKKIVNRNSFDTLAIDEVQFFENELVIFIKELKNINKKIFLSGLDLDYKGLEWETTKQISSIADKVVNLKAVCSVCKKKNALFTSRIEKSNKPILIGGKGVYEPRCKKHYIINFS